MRTSKRPFLTMRLNRPAIAGPKSSRGFVLIALLAMLAIGGLYFFVSNLSPEFLRAKAQQQNGDSLAQAREALIGYAIRLRDDQLKSGTSGVVYGYLPMPDLGTSRNNNTGCTEEGCEAANFAGNAAGYTVIGRLPWRTLGIGPLRDSSGECLWYAVSGSHQRIQRQTPMNWDTLSHLDVVVANGTAAMISAISSAHDRPIAVIFAPGPPLSGQNRSASASDVISECGGNYNAVNYLDPVSGSELAGITNYLSGSTNGASGDTSAATKSLSAGGPLNRRSGGNLWSGTCPAGNSDDCNVVANDSGTMVTADHLFRTLRGSNYFRADINTMLDSMAGCLRDQIAGGVAITPVALDGFTGAADKSVGRIPDLNCFGDTYNPLGYYSHYRDQIFYLKPNVGALNIALDGGSPQNCVAALAFSGQRGIKNPAPTDIGESVTQLRTAVAVSATNTILNTNWPANYLESNNLSAFTTSGANSLDGQSIFSLVSSSQAASQDIVRCIPAGASLTAVAPTVSADAGNLTLARYAPATGILTLGSADLNSNFGANASELFACAWSSESHAAGTGFRSYFRFRVRRVGEGFTFAVIDGDRNGTDACGASRQHLGYSGDNGNALIPEIAWPKLAIEFDMARNCSSAGFDGSGLPSCTFTESGSSLSNGRNDPCYTTSCWSGSPLYPGTSQGLDNSSHVAIVYWGYGAANAGAGVTQPLLDDNYHGFPTPPDSSARPAPRNPAAQMPYPTPAPDPPGGVAPLDRMGGTTGAFREFHARLELTRSFTQPTDAKNGVTTVLTKFFIEAQPAANISAMTYNAGSPPTLSVTTASAHSLNTGDTVVIKDAVPTGYNGEYTVTVSDTTHFTATLPEGTANPGRYISAITWADVSGNTDRATVTSASHGLNTGNSITISGAFPPEYNVSRTITRIDANSYRFGLELDYEPGDMAPAIATPKALTARAKALANTTRPMSELDAAAKSFVQDTASIHDEQMSACAASAPLCPTGQSCGSDNMCYKPSFRNLRLGFTMSERPTTNTTTARGQLIEIRDRATTWLQ
jgi:hypothetical protein